MLHKFAVKQSHYDWDEATIIEAEFPDEAATKFWYKWDEEDDTGDIPGFDGGVRVMNVAQVDDPGKVWNITVGSRLKAEYFIESF